MPLNGAKQRWKLEGNELERKGGPGSGAANTDRSFEKFCCEEKQRSRQKLDGDLRCLFCFASSCFYWEILIMLNVDKNDEI